MLYVRNYTETLFTRDVELLKLHQMHVVVEADARKGSLCYQYICTYLGEAPEALRSYVERTNAARSASSLYSRHYVSLLPSLDLSRQGLPEDTLIKGILEDVLVEANCRLMRTSVLLFVFSPDNAPDGNRLVRILRDVVKDHQEVPDLLKEILVYPALLKRSEKIDG